MTRRLAREEGILVGNSAGSAIAGLVQLGDQLTEDDVVVVLFHDHASRYIGKIFNDEWMRERGFLDDELRVQDIIDKKNSKEFLTVDAKQKVREVLDMMKSKEISQMPVLQDGEIVGSIIETNVLQYVLQDPYNNAEKSISEVMGEPFPTVKTDLPSSKLIRMITKQTPAVLARDKAGALHIITEYDILQCL